MGMCTQSWNEEDRWDRFERVRQELQNDSSLTSGAYRDFDKEAIQIVEQEDTDEG